MRTYDISDKTGVRFSGAAICALISIVVAATLWCANSSWRQTRLEEKVNDLTADVKQIKEAVGIKDYVRDKSGLAAIQ